MARTMGYTIRGPPSDTSTSPLQKSLSIRREPKVASNLRTLYRDSAGLDDEASFEDGKTALNGIPATPQLPPTPPTPPGPQIETQELVLDESSSDAAIFRSTLVTPIHQHSPPTPDDTPPRQRKILRPFLGTQPSMASTGAESFKTAREEIASEDDYEPIAKSPDNGSIKTAHLPLRAVSTEHRLQPSALARSALSDTTDAPNTTEAQADSPTLPREEPSIRQSASDTHQRAQPTENRKSPAMTHHQVTATPSPRIDPDFAPRDLTNVQIRSKKRNKTAKTKLLETNNLATKSDGLRRGASLRDRLAVAQQHSASASTEKFASIIGWSNSISAEPTQEERRLSGVSTTSTVEAYVVHSSPLPRRKTTLRHVSKNDSLRSASSPLPKSNRDSLNSNSESPHRLVHKKAILSNQNRWSFGSEVSKSYSLSSSYVLPKAEIIRVAVIPERRSSLQSSADSSKRHSLSTNSVNAHSRKASDNPPSSWQRKRTASETTERGRDKNDALVVPPRSSSLSAPTSRNTSRANSITSENLRVKRREAESELRRTLDRMESDRLVATMTGIQSQDLNEGAVVRGYNLQTQPTLEVNSTPVTNKMAGFSRADEDPTRVIHHLQPPTNGTSTAIVPGSAEWAALRPPSILETPFSQPSFQSASPEINEARAVNFFPHNNHSLQLIEPNPMQESRAVREVRRQQISEVDSPLRNPRNAPEPPRFQIIPPTPLEDAEAHLDEEGPVTSRRSTSVRRPVHRRNSGSFVKSLTRNLTLKNARNKKADQDLDSSLHPFWRPRAFWDEEDNDRPKDQDRSLEDTGRVSNSLGLPQDRIVINGPVSLVRRISERRKQNRGIVKQTSQGSLARLRASRKLYTVPGLGINFHFLGLRDMQHRLLSARQRKDEEKREARRRLLRESIGPEIILQGDSRFPASQTSLGQRAPMEREMSTPCIPLTAAL